MAATCPKCSAELPRQVLWNGLKSTTLSSTVPRVEIKCPQCRQLLRITPNSVATIQALAILSYLPITLWIIYLMPALYPHVVAILIFLALIPLTFALLIVLYLKLARFQEKPSTTSIRG